MVVDGRKGKPINPPRYEVFLQEQYEELQVALEEAENDRWHHEPEGAPLRTHYDRLLTWLAALEVRIAWWNGIQADGPRPAPILTRERNPSSDCLER